jgi:hypothetical protein
MNKIIILLLIITSCTTYHPFNSLKEKKLAKKTIKKSLKSNYKYLLKHDSIFLETYLSLSKNIENPIKKKGFDSLIKRRLDSFYLKKYSKSELLFLLKIDRKLYNVDMIFEINRDEKSPNYPKFKTIEKAIDSILKIRKLMDSMKFKPIDSTKTNQ